MSQLLRGAVFAALTLAVITSQQAGAQAFPNINKAKEAAARSVDATNAHTSAMTADQSPQPVVQPAMQSNPPQKNGVIVSSSGSVKSSSSSSTTNGKPGPGTAQTPTPHNGKGAPGATAPAPGSKTEISLLRESFNYTADGRRDPFMSLMKTGELRPAVSDLKLVTVIYDPAGRSVAILRDLTTKEQYRIKVGQTLGRMRVASIQPKSVTFTVIAIGTTFQEVLALNDTTRARTQ
ncbi:MAG TPA: hypothetical protein VGQ76_11700 [Thermoanaerobaculia bacterium]|jgi:hypothetical protein|nr:hypothetical protein [Thermoanaerobaculia bacterium]